MNKLSRLGIKQLRIMAALLKDGNLSQVADQMGLTQQAISANLATLREVFGDPLFVRTGRGVLPTALALEMGSEINAILAALERLVERGPFDPMEVRATVNISASDYAHAVAVAPRLRAIRDQAPHLKLILSEAEVDTLPARMGSGEIDLAVNIPANVPASFERRVLFQEHYVCVAAAASPLAGKRLSLKALAQQQHVVVSPARANLVGSADGWLQQLGLERNIILSVPHFLLMPQVLEATGAVAFLPSRLLPHPGLARVRLDGDVVPPGFELIAAWHPRAASSPLASWLVGMLAR
ncbi:LysR family transcriptional regulator [Massilia sp. CFBP9012]|uniref:LysR family transcriptional regulator n=1 Tax=Massilia sp. CFBP9012 TaxID=3096531 RepID=UPI002A6AD0E7|nr:LysR family transcriptional regulator [Massilia sp. CFBP9012]MDY0973803.1 LysR family transcriptional regulator [Massilia sp. CFBP9012]